MRRNTNKLGFGFLLGLAIPLLIFVAVFLAGKKEIALSDYLYNLWKLGAFLKVMSLCVLPNLALFLYFYRVKYDFAARGVLMATFVFAFVVMLSKLL